MPQLNEIGRFLARLGDTATAVARALRTHDIRGVRNTVRHLNPIVRYLQAHIRVDDYELSVPHKDGRYCISLITSGGVKEMELPAPINDFLTAFNRGDYPDLELPPLT